MEGGFLNDMLQQNLLYIEAPKQPLLLEPNLVCKTIQWGLQDEDAHIKYMAWQVKKSILKAK